MSKKAGVVSRVLLVLLLIYFFLVSIGLMGAAFKGFGRGFAENLIRTTSNPFVGLFIGILATSLVQSSSTTTSILVGMVGSNVITVGNAIPIVMGANIGTTVTNTLVSLGHFTRREEFRRAFSGATVHDFFNLICVLIMFPLELATGFLEHLATAMSHLFANVGGMKFTSPVKLATGPCIDLIEYLLKDVIGMPNNVLYASLLIVSVVILFLSLIFLVKLMRSLVIGRVEAALDSILSKNAPLAIMSGLFVTAIIQSSSITTSLLVPMVAAGILTLEAAFPIVVGANIGTTSTAILASFAAGNPSAIVIAFAHFLFNAIGVLIIYPIKPFRVIPIRLAQALGQLAYEKRRYAFVYVIGVFFLGPGLLILIYNLLK